MLSNQSVISSNETVGNNGRKAVDFFTFRIIFYPTLIVVGCILNGMVIVVLKATHLKLSYVYRYLLINLAIADIGILLLAAVVSVLVAPAVQWQIGEVLCRLLVPVGDTLIPVSSGTLFLLAIARYRAIKDPFAQQWSRSVVLILIALDWFASMLFAVTPLQVWIKVISVRGGSLQRCYLSAPLWHVQVWYASVIAVLVIPTLASLWLIVLTSKRSLGSSNSVKRYGTNRTSLTRKKENKHATQLIMATSVVYTVLVMPYFALTLALRCGLRNTEAVRILLEFTQVLFYSQCVIDPVLYCLINKGIRKRMLKTHRRIFACICKLIPKYRRPYKYSMAFRRKSRISEIEMEGRFQTSITKVGKLGGIALNVNGMTLVEDLMPK